MRSIEEILAQGKMIGPGIRITADLSIAEHVLVWRASKYRENEAIMFLGEPHLIHTVEYIELKRYFVIELRVATLCDL